MFSHRRQRDKLSCVSSFKSTSPIMPAPPPITISSNTIPSPNPHLQIPPYWESGGWGASNFNLWVGGWGGHRHSAHDKWYYFFLWPLHILLLNRTQARETNTEQRRTTWCVNWCACALLTHLPLVDWQPSLVPPPTWSSRSISICKYNYWSADLINGQHTNYKNYSYLTQRIQRESLLR